jgi:hypothetical protein
MQQKNPTSPHGGVPFVGIGVHGPVHVSLHHQQHAPPFINASIYIEVEFDCMGMSVITPVCKLYLLMKILVFSVYRFFYSSDLRFPLRIKKTVSLVRLSLSWSSLVYDQRWLYPLSNVVNGHYRILRPPCGHVQWQLLPLDSWSLEETWL